jgi:predicted NAD-dependent protein-ADP-ribosyltransferase YbiA (DUF1768 family)
MCSQLVVTFDRKRLRSGVTILWISRLLAVIIAHTRIERRLLSAPDSVMMNTTKLDHAWGIGGLPVFRSPGSIGCQTGSRSLLL